MERIHFALALVAVVALAACPQAPTAPDPNAGGNETSTAELSVEDGFDFSMEQQVSVELEVYGVSGQPHAGAQVQIYADVSDGREPAQLVHAGQTNSAGRFLVVMPIAEARDELTIRVHSVGISGLKTIPIVNSRVYHQFGK